MYFVFKTATMAELLQQVTGELMVDTWQGIKKLKMRIVDVHFESREPEIVDEEEEDKKKCDVCNGGNKTAEAPPVGPEEPKNFELADFIDNYVEKNGMTGLYEMMGYSNFLGIKPLLYLCCAKMALMMKDKSLEEIKTLVESGL